jgi:hypothetical protein
MNLLNSWNTHPAMRLPTPFFYLSIGCIIFLSIYYLHFFFEVYILAPSVLWVCFSGLHLCCPLLSAPRAQSCVYEVQSYQVASAMQRPKWLHQICAISLNNKSELWRATRKKSMEKITFMAFSHLPSWNQARFSVKRKDSNTSTNVYFQTRHLVWCRGQESG